MVQGPRRPHLRRQARRRPPRRPRPPSLLHASQPRAHPHAQHPDIIYDQIGTGQSTHLQEKPKEFWTVELFMDELDNLLAKLGVADNFDLGHSWGGMLAADYVATRQPPGLKRLVLADTPASMPLWEVCMAKLLGRFPEDFQKMVKKHEGGGTTDSKEYQDGMQVFYQKHVCKLSPWPADLLKTFAGVDSKDPTVSTTMLGRCDFNISGSLKTWNVLDRVDRITCPTLVLNGVDDEAQDECVLPFFEKIPKVKWVRFADSSHTALFEEKDRYLQVVDDFLTK
ncbi:proline-specific peptidase [Gloeopeniophorella convolvens]|nr:proline-specific peptidase [Gloeopeniophorella convolvens]